jgi:eukaryotic-like serine/threonine-protein kinase
MRRDISVVLPSEIVARERCSLESTRYNRLGLPPHQLGPGSRLGTYEIVDVIGAGGMGEVYRARDVRLGRHVAIKVLLPAVASSAERLARFEREAQTLASLNHPNIAQLFGIEEAAIGSFLVMELVEGPTLADRIRESPIAVDEALAIAIQIADALEAAHERGIIHRDLKPANIKVRGDGTVKVLDFGLAKVVEPPDRDAAVDLSQSPTRTSPALMTNAGVILGTAAYMSPEQARSRPVDQRTDVWAFGCVLFEMLTRHQAFAGATVTDVLAAIIEREPDWRLLPARTPDNVRRLLRRCLAKDGKRRLHHIADARIELGDTTSGSGVATLSPPVRSATLPWVVAGVSTLVAVAAVGWLLTRRPTPSLPSGPPADARLERLTYDPGITRMPAVSPDGRLLAYASDRAGNGDRDIWVQQMPGGAPLRLTDDPADDSTPDFSPDGSQVVFRSERNGGGIYVVPALGGPARSIAADGRGPRFSPDGSRIAYWTGQFRGMDISNRTSHAFVMALSGGAPIPLLPEFDVATDPVWSPDGRSLIVAGRRKQRGPETEPFDWWIVPLDGKPPIKTGVLETPTIRAAITVCGRWTSDGVVFSSGDDLWMVKLSEKGTIDGVPRRLTLGVGPYVDPAIGSKGQIVFARIVAQRLVERASLSNVGEQPARLYADSESTAWRASTTSDGSLIVIEREVGDSREIWTKNIRSGRQELIVRVTARGPANAVISPDGARIAYTEDSSASLAKPRTGYVIETAGGVPRKICDACSLHGFLSDNRRVLADVDDGHAIRLIDTRDGTVRDLVTVNDGSVLDRPHASPDDRWLAYRRNRRSAGKTHIVRLPFDRVANADETPAIDEPTTTGRPLGWSLDSRVLYLLLDTDGFRCVWGQPVDASGRPTGKPTAVRHFHTTEGMSTSMGNAVNADGFVYEANDMTANIWRMSRSGF